MFSQGGRVNAAVRGDFELIYIFISTICRPRLKFKTIMLSTSVCSQIIHLAPLLQNSGDHIVHVGEKLRQLFGWRLDVTWTDLCAKISNAWVGPILHYGWTNHISAKVVCGLARPCLTTLHDVSVCIRSGGHSWMAIQLHLINAGHNAVPVGLPRKLHVRRIQCFPHEEADLLPVR